MVVRLSDVAGRAGVSVKTVSNVVHGYAHVRPETRARVQQIIDELGYQPNLTARGLRQGRTGLVALAVPILSQPYFAELASAVVAEAAELGWTVLVDQTDGKPEREREAAAGLRGHLIDGLILSPVSLEVGELSRSQADIPLVLLGERDGPGLVDHVGVDNVAAASAATAHLLGRGGRRVAAIGLQGPEHSASGVAALRRRGYETTLVDAGHRVDPVLAPQVDGYGRAHGAAAMRTLLDLRDPPDAVFCFNDTLALGALRTLADRGVRVPQDVAVVGFDDIEETRYSVPTLTTMAPDKRAIARAAVRLLAERIDGPSDLVDPLPPRDIRIPHQLVVRESTAAPYDRAGRRSGRAS
jgi:DNA-binding LacI/PurR family transcriptional regulator